MSHSYSNNYVHVVYSTANRQNLIPPELEPRLYSFVAEIARKESIPLIAAGGMPNHSHLLFLLPQTMALSVAINTLKTNSSRFMSQLNRLQLADELWRFPCQLVACRNREGVHSQSTRAPQEEDIRAGIPAFVEEGACFI